MLMANPNRAGATRRRRIEGYLGRLYGYAVGLVGERDQARDLVQECALKALSAAREPEDEAAYRAWLFRILRNAFLDRRRRPAEKAVPLEDDLPAGEWSDGPWRYNDEIITVLTVRLGMAKLSPAHREVIALVDIGGFSYAEAAGLLGVPKGTVMSRLCRARRALLEVIDEGEVRPLPVPARRAAL